MLSPSGKMTVVSAYSLRELIRRDIAANRGYTKSIVVMTLFRVTHHVKYQRGALAKVVYRPLAVIYKLITEWLLGVEIPIATRIGPGLRLRHGIGVVINPFVIIGEDVMIRQSVTLGNRHADDDCPTIGDRAELGAGAIIIGRCRVGVGARIAAGSVVIHDVPDGATAHPTAATIRTRAH